MKDKSEPPLREASISIIIPTYNGGQAFGKCLEGIRRQEGVGPVELIVVDSGSRDGTPAVAEEAGARLLNLQREQFNHGAARDLGAQSASGDLLVFTVQDARPVDEKWLRYLAEPLLRGAAASTSRILPRPEASPLARRTVLDSPLASEEPFETDPGSMDLGALSPAALRWAARFDDISSSIRADVYRELPFRAVKMSEDLHWALEALHRGFRLVFSPRSMVYHAHEYTPMGIYRRYRADAAAVHEALGLKAREGLGHALKGFLYEVSRDWAFLWKLGAFAFVKHGAVSPVLRGFQVAGQWRGSA